MNYTFDGCVRCDTLYDPKHLTKRFPLLTYCTLLALARPQNANKNSSKQQPFYRNSSLPNSLNWSFNGRGRRSRSSSDRSTRVFQSGCNSAPNQKHWSARGNRRQPSIFQLVQNTFNLQHQLCRLCAAKRITSLSDQTPRNRKQRNEKNSHLFPAVLAAPKSYPGRNN